MVNALVPKRKAATASKAPATKPTITAADVASKAATKSKAPAKKPAIAASKVALKAATGSKSQVKKPAIVAAKVAMKTSKRTAPAPQTESPIFKRAKLVGRFPGIVNLPAPTPQVSSRFKLSEEARRRLLASMKLD